MAYVHGPIAATLSMNILLFILTAVNIWRTGDDAASTLKTRQKKRKYCNQVLSSSFQIPLKTDFSTWTELCYVSLFHPCSWEEHGVYMYYLMTHKFIIHMQMASLIYRLELSFSYFTFVKEMFLDCFGKGCILKRKTVFHPYDDYSAELNSAREWSWEEMILKLQMPKSSSLAIDILFVKHEIRECNCQFYISLPFVTDRCIGSTEIELITRVYKFYLIDSLKYWLKLSKSLK